MFFFLVLANLVELERQARNGEDLQQKRHHFDHTHLAVCTALGTTQKIVHVEEYPKHTASHVQKTSND